MTLIYILVINHRYSRHWTFVNYLKVGVAAVQLARAHGLRVLGSAGSDAGIEVVERAGAHEVFNHKENGYLDKVMVGILSRAFIHVFVSKT